MLNIHLDSFDCLSHIDKLNGLYFKNDHSQIALLIFYNYQGYKILTGSHVGKDALQIWDYSTDYSTDRSKKPQLVDFPGGEKGPFIYAAQFCDNDVVIAGGSGTNSAMAMNTETNQVSIIALVTRLYNQKIKL